MVVSSWNRARARFSSQGISSQGTSPPMRGLLSARRVLVQSSSCSVRWDVMMELMKEEPASSSSKKPCADFNAGRPCKKLKPDGVACSMCSYRKLRRLFKTMLRQGVSLSRWQLISWQRSSWRKPFRMVLSPAGKAWTRCHDACVPWCYL